MCTVSPSGTKRSGKKNSNVQTLAARTTHVAAGGWVGEVRVLQNAVCDVWCVVLGRGGDGVLSAYVVSRSQAESTCNQSNWIKCKRMSLKMKSVCGVWSMALSLCICSL